MARISHQPKAKHKAPPRNSHPGPGGHHGTGGGIVRSCRRSRLVRSGFMMGDASDQLPELFRDILSGANGDQRHFPSQEETSGALNSFIKRSTKSGTEPIGTGIHFQLTISFGENDWTSIG